MAFDGNGTFVRLYSWVADKINGIPITASRVDGEDTGFAAGLSLCLTRDGQGQVTADFDPSVDNTYALGNAGKRWSGLYTPWIQSTPSDLQAWDAGISQFVSIAPLSGAFTGTLTGISGTPAVACKWAITAGRLVTLQVAGVTGTSNSTAFTLTGLPTVIRPATLLNQYLGCPYGALANNGVTSGANGNCEITTGGVMTFLLNGNPAGWTATGVKGVNNAFQISYLLL